jgi:hypothetical protein
MISVAAMSEVLNDLDRAREMTGYFPANLAGRRLLHIDPRENTGMSKSSKNLCAIGFHSWVRSLNCEGRKSRVIQICEHCGKRQVVLILRYGRRRAYRNCKIAEVFGDSSR